MLKELLKEFSSYEEKKEILEVGRYLPTSINDVKFLNVYFNVKDVDILARDNGLEFIRPFNDEKVYFNFYAFLLYSRRWFDYSIPMDTPSNILKWYYGYTDWDDDEVELFLKAKREVFAKYDVRLNVSFVLFGDWSLSSKENLYSEVKESELVNSRWLKVLDDNNYLFNFCEYQRSR